MLHLLLLSLVFASLGQSCRFLPYGATSPLVNNRIFQDCLLGLKFDRASATRTIDTIMKTLPLYAFLDIVKDSPQNGLAHIQLDLVADLQRINNTLYDSDADFQQDLADLFLRLRDPHTYYKKPSECYSVFALQPIVFGSRLVGNRQTIYVRSLLEKFISDPLYRNIPLISLIGAEVTFIDEQPALAEILEFARLYGFLSKDDGSAFNWALASGYQQRPMSYLPVPLGASQHIEFAFSNGTFLSLHLPWGIFFQAAVDYNSTGCKASALKVKKHKTIIDDFFLPTELRSEFQHNKHKKTHSSFATDPSISIHNVSADTVVLQISSFAPENNRKFLAVVQDVINMGTQGNIPNLILDLRGNGGGDICLGYQVIYALLAESNPIGHYDIIHSPLMTLLVNNSNPNTQLTGAHWWTQENGQPFQDKSWYEPGQKHSRGGVDGMYSNPSYHNCDFSSKTPAHLFKKILILSDGLCGSTCAVFSSHLMAVDHVESAVIGGIWGPSGGLKQQPFSFPGGQVLDYVNINRLAASLGLASSELVPQPFPNSAGLRFAWLEIYPWLGSDPSNTPLEFYFMPAEFRIPMWSPFTQSDFDTLYRMAEKLFDQ